MRTRYTGGRTFLLALVHALLELGVYMAHHFHSHSHCCCRCRFCHCCYWRCHSHSPPLSPSLLPSLVLRVWLHLRHLELREAASLTYHGLGDIAVEYGSDLPMVRYLEGPALSARSAVVNTLRHWGHLQWEEWGDPSTAQGRSVEPRQHQQRSTLQRFNAQEGMSSLSHYRERPGQQVSESSTYHRLNYHKCYDHNLWARPPSSYVRPCARAHAHIHTGTHTRKITHSPCHRHPQLPERARKRVQKMMHYQVSLRPFTATIQPSQSHDDLGGGSDEDDLADCKTPGGGSGGSARERTGTPVMCTPQSFPPSPNFRAHVMARSMNLTDGMLE